MKKTYILKDQGKGTVTNLPIEKIVEISGSSSSNGGGSATGDFIPLTGTEEGKNITGDLNFQKGTWALSIRNTHVDNGNEFPDEPPVIEIYKVPYDNNQNGLRIEKDFIRSTGGGSRRTSYYISSSSLGFSGKQFENININYEFSLSPQQDGSCLVDSYTIPDGTYTKIKSKGLYGSFDYSDVEPENKLIYAQRSYVDSKISAASGNSYTTEEVATGGVYEFYDWGVDFDGTFPFPNAELVRKPIYRKTVIISGDDLANLNGAPLINYFPGMRVLCPFRDVIIAGTGVGYIRKVYYGMNNEFCSVQIDTDPMGNNIINFKDSTGAVKDITQCKMITITLEYTKEGSIVSPIF